MSRKAARDTAMRLLYEYEITGSFNKETIKIMEDELNHGLNSLDLEYVDVVMQTFCDKKDEIDTAIDMHADGWDIDRLSKIDLTIMRLALFEIISIESIPYKVSINEAVELAKRYSGDKSPGFINGILGGYVNQTIIGK